MVRWYDYFAATFFADLLFSFAAAAIAASAVNIVYTLLFAAMVWLIYDLWINTYCKLRLLFELRK
jgi:hypothetical protein